MNIPGYDDWKTQSPYDYQTPLQEAQSEILSLQDENDALQQRLDTLADALEDALEKMWTYGFSEDDLRPIRKLLVEEHSK